MSHDPAHWLLTTSRHVLRARSTTPLPTQVPVGPGQFTRAAHAAARTLRDADPRWCVVGALPFDEDTPAALALGRVTATPRQRRPGPPAVSTGPHRVDTRGEAAYVGAVAKAVRRLRAGEAHKVVLARTLTLRRDIDPAATLALLDRLHPLAHLFHVALDPPGTPGARALLGASPELLLTRQGDLLALNPLAGTASRHRDPVRDLAAAHALAASVKDLREHALVVDELRRVLHPLCTRLHIPDRPRLKAAGRLWHLCTPIRARLRRPAPTAFALAALLHPAPAVCGLPREAAHTLIRRLETRPRDYYGGLVGWTDRHGDGQWVVALRCAQTDPDGVRLHAGAGILAESDPRRELAETRAEFTTMLDALRPAPVVRSHHSAVR